MRNDVIASSTVSYRRLQIVIAMMLRVVLKL